MIQSFAAIAEANAKCLILGSMPGILSLEKNQYYAHPRNQFWRIMCHLLNEPTAQTYGEKKLMLLQNRIALWDVVGTCVRTGSLDANIQSDSVVPNNFVSFFEQHPHITHLFFNGKAAEKWFKQLVAPSLKSPYATTLLPSTSPAHAGLSFENKLKRWHQVVEALSS